MCEVILLNEVVSFHETASFCFLRHILKEGSGDDGEPITPPRPFYPPSAIPTECKTLNIHMGLYLDVCLAKTGLLQDFGDSFWAVSQGV